MTVNDLKQLTPYLSADVREIISVIGYDSTAKLINEFGGTKVYIPKADRLERLLMDRPAITVSIRLTADQVHRIGAEMTHRSVTEKIVSIVGK